MNLQKLHAIRDGHRGVIQRHLQNIEDAKSDSTLIEFSTILEALEMKMKILESINYTIDTEIKFRKLKAFLEQQTQPKVQEPPPLSLRETASIQENSQQAEQPRPWFSQSTSAGPQINTNALPATSSIVSNDLHSHRLPKLTLPSFDGDILKWQTFWDCFESTIHLNNHLTDVSKFAYLQSQLEGAAAHTIEGFALTNANYSRAISLLQNRFGSPHRMYTPPCKL